MIRLIGLWAVGCALCATPVAADENVYDGPVAVKPLTVTPRPQESASPDKPLTVTPQPQESASPDKPLTVTPQPQQSASPDKPLTVTPQPQQSASPNKPLTVTPRSQRSASSNAVCDFEHHCYPEKGGPRTPGAPPVVAARPVAPRAPAASASRDDPVVAMWRECMAEALQGYQESHDLHGLQAMTATCQVRLEEQGGENLAGTEAPTASPPLASVSHNGRRNLGCGWWPIGSDADRDCAAGGHRF